MITKSGTHKNYTYYEYTFDKTTVRYIVMNETKSTFMILFPNDMSELVFDDYMTVKFDDSDGYPDHRDWLSGSLVHLHLSHHMNSMYDNSFKFGESDKGLIFDRQEVEKTDDSEVIKTYLTSEEGYSVCHILSHYGTENGFEVKSVFMNNTGKPVTLEMISSASLDGLCPFDNDDGSESLVLHRFKGGWSLEGKHIESTLPEMSMEKSWGGSYESEKFGSIGSKTVCRNYPYAAIEDRRNGCTWGIKIKHNATWQIELTRYGTDLSLSTGIGDLAFGAWSKIIENEGSFETPVAYIAVAKGGIAEVSADLVEMNDRDIDAYGEEGMPIIFNEWCTTQGKPTPSTLLPIAKKLCETKVKYFVVDDGWQTKEVGDWIVDTEKFPNGFGEFADEIRNMGMIPGIWLEFETVRKNADRYAKEYDHLYLTKNGIPVESAVCNSVPSKLLDFRKEEVVEYLDKAVIEFLKKNHIGYIKVDYNSNIGLGCDGAESLGEGLRQHMEGVYEFFKKIKREIPDIIIENCSTGGSRLEPKMMGVTAMSSFSDASKCFELPIIAANMHYLISPRQSQIWCVIKKTFDRKHMQYIISSGFLGRICWSGYMTELSDEQFGMIVNAEKFYEKVSDIIKSGRSIICRTDYVNYRNPKGTQAVVRYSKDKSRALVVCHFFNEPKELKIKLDSGYTIQDSLYPCKCSIEGDYLTICGEAKNGNVIYLVKE